MLSRIKAFFSGGRNLNSYDWPILSNELADFTNEPHHTKKFTAVADTAQQLRDLALSGAISLKREEKIRLIKIINKLKLHALMRSDDEGYRIFAVLESVGSDLLRVF